MSLSLKKGHKVSLFKEGETLHEVVVACGWDANDGSSPHEYDLDMATACLGPDGKIPNIDDPLDPGYRLWFLHANHRFLPAEIRCLNFGGDNRTGHGDGDDEYFEVILDMVPAEITRLLFAVVIWKAMERLQQFGDIRNAYIRIYNKRTGEEMMRYNLTESFENETLVAFGELYRHAGGWKFNALGEGYVDPKVFRAKYGIVYPFETEYARRHYPNPLNRNHR